MAYELSFGQWVASRRKELRLRRPDLATQVGCAVVTLRKIETDERRPSQQLATLLAERLGLAPLDRAMFVRVARGEFSADRLPTLPLQNSGPSRASQIPESAAQREPLRVFIPTNLPAPLTSFVGRGEDLAAIPALMEAQRLITLTGVGGVGKTRLAIELGIRLARGEQMAVGGQPDIARDGVWIVELASLAQPALAAQAIAQLFRLPEQSGRTTLELLQEHLAQKQLLLILDNCEHLIEVCAEIAEQLLLHCWQLRIVATSREPLRVPGERVRPVLPLTLPEPGELQPAQILATPAAQLFIERMDVGAGAPADQLEGTAAETIAQICRQLDGIPLALELAAPLSRSLSLAEIAAQLQNQMAILTNAYRTAIPRHQTMHSALVWSYRLLAPEEQRLLASVAVFSGGWTLAAAQAVCADSSMEIVLGPLQQLVAKSLVLREEQDGQPRYRLLEPVRQFAQAQLAATGMEDEARRRHAAYFLSLAEQMHRARDTSQEFGWLRRLEPERDNLRAVNIWAIDQHEAELAHRFNGWLFAFWIYRSSQTETRHWVETALTLRAATPTPAALTAEALALDVAGYLAVAQRDYATGQACFQRELECYTTTGHQPGIATAYRGLGYNAMQRGDLHQAEPFTARSLVVSQSVQDRWGAAWSLFDLGCLAFMRGDLARAQDQLEQALPEMRDQDILFGAFRALIALGHIMRTLGDEGRAFGYYRDALQIQQRMGYIQVTSDVLGALAGLAVARGQIERAARLFGADRAVNEAYAAARWSYLDTTYAHDLALARSALSAEQWEAAWEQGYHMTLDQAVAYALSE